MFAMNGLNTSGLALRPEMYSEIRVLLRATFSRLPLAFGPCCANSGVAACSVVPACCVLAAAIVGPTIAPAQTAANAAVPPRAPIRRNDLRLTNDFDVLP